MINVTTKRSDPNPTVGVEAGSYDTYRAVGTYSRAEGDVKPFLAYEGYTRGGYRDNSDYERYNAFNKVSLPFGNGLLSLRAHALKTDFGAPGYLPVDDVRSGLRSRRDAVNDTDGGETESYDLVANYVPMGEGGLYGTLYAGSDEFSRFATFGTGTQRVDFSERDYAGWRLYYNWAWGDRASLTVGTDGQYNNGDFLRFGSTGGVADQADLRIDRRVESLDTGIFAQGQVRFLERFKAVGGIRYDRFDVDVDNRVTPSNSGSGDSDIVSPKLGLVYSASPRLDLFANAAQGFRSPSAEELSPDPDITQGQLPQGFNEGLDPFELDTVDIGFSANLFSGFNVTFDYFWTDAEGELVQNLGTGIFENVGETERNGYELSFNYFVNENLGLYASFTGVDAKLKNPAVAGEDEVTGVPEDAQTFGLTWARPLPNNLRLVVDGYIQRQGEAPINEAGTEVSPSVTRYGVKTSLTRGPLSGFVQAVYHPDEFASQAFLGSGFDPQPELEVFAGIKYAFE